jgi:hypothetical protein
MISMFMRTSIVDLEPAVISSSIVSVTSFVTSHGPGGVDGSYPSSTWLSTLGEANGEVRVLKNFLTATVASQK